MSSQMHIAENVAANEELISERLKFYTQEADTKTLDLDPNPVETN